MLNETSPYGSREVVLEDDGRTVYLYLIPERPEDPAEPVAVWVANRVAAPETDDLASMAAGTPPLMPRHGTRHPAGRPPFPPEDLELVWFEAGDGVALLERGALLAVIPGWAGQDGFPGYSREAVGQQSLAWELEDALDSLGPRIESARRYWEWRAQPESWSAIQDTGLRHLESRMGPQRRYWAADGGGWPPRAVVQFEPADCPGVSVCATVGMGAQPMPQVELYVEDPAPFRRIELALGTTGDPAAAARLLSGMMASPWANVTWLGDGHTWSWNASPTIAAGSVMLLCDPPADGKRGLKHRGQAAPDLSGVLDRSGDPVTYLWVVPLSEGEVELAEQGGSAAVIREMRRRGRGWVWRTGER